jgi:hypothetical protein
VTDITEWRTGSLIVCIRAAHSPRNPVEASDTNGFPAQAAKDKPSIDAQGAIPDLRCRRSRRLGAWVYTRVVRLRLDPLNAWPSAFANELPALIGALIGAKLEKGPDHQGPVGCRHGGKPAPTTLSTISSSIRRRTKNFRGAPKTVVKFSGGMLWISLRETSQVSYKDRSRHRGRTR